MVGKDDFLSVLDGKEDLLIIKGQLLRPEPREKQDHSGYYIIFEIKVVKESAGTNKYETQFGSYSIIVASSESKEMAPVLKEMKNQEVLAIVRPNARIRKGTNGGKFNSIDLYLESIYLISDFRTVSLADCPIAL